MSDDGVATGAAGDANVRVGGATHRPLLSLADAARAIAGASTVADLLREVTEAARAIVGTHQAVGTRLYGGTWERATTYVALSEKYAEYRSYDVVPKGLGVLNAVTRENRPLRLTTAELLAHPEYRELRDAPPGHPPLPDYLAAPFVSRNGENIGLLQLAEKVDGTPFTEDDEAVCVQLALMVSSALEHVELAGQLEQTLSRLQLALDASSTGTWEWRFATGELVGSPVLDEIYGGLSATFDELVARLPAEDTAAIEELRALRHITGHAVFRHRVVRPDGSVRWVEGEALPAYDASEQLVGVTALCVDVTDRHLAEDALRRERDVVSALHQVGRTVTARLEQADVVQTVTDAATALTGAQFGAFFYNVVSESGESYSLYTISGVAAENFSKFPMPRNTDIFAPTFNGDGVVRVDDVTQDARYGKNAPYHGMPKGHLPVRSYLAVPVVLSDGEVAGGLFFGHENAAVFDGDAEQLAVGIAGYAAIALENGRLYEAARRESRSKQAIAVALERPLQPPPLPDVEGVELAATYQPYGGQGDLGGDFYDVFELPGGRWLVALGDVSGKGPEAAAVTGLVRYTLWAAAQSTNDPVAILRVVNTALLRQDTDRFATVVAAVLTPGARGVAVEAAWAGHPSAILLRADGGEQVRGRGMPLGMFDTIDLQAVRLHVLPGETLLLYTDGLVERRGAVLDEHALVELATSAAALPAEGLIDRIVGAVDERYPRRDDLAVLVIRAA
ncbi:MAG TPA: SpoIIE family protein phosphatase [Frankiaceae bacterium]|nr:SpoIIE family protein phosphatase [Frankiaceae bacterium]